MLVQRGLLDQRSDASQDVRQRSPKWLAEEADLSGDRLEQTQEHANDGSLTCSIGTEEPEDAAARHSQGQVMHDHLQAVTTGHPFRFDGEFQGVPAAQYT